MSFKYKNRHYSELIGNTIGLVHDVEVDTNDISWGPYLRVGVDVNLSKLLTRGRSLKVRDDNLWIPIKYIKTLLFLFGL